MSVNCQACHEGGNKLSHRLQYIESTDGTYIQIQNSVKDEELAQLRHFCFISSLSLIERRKQTPSYQLGGWIVKFVQLRPSLLHLQWSHPQALRTIHRSDRSHTAVQKFPILGDQFVYLLTVSLTTTHTAQVELQFIGIAFFPLPQFKWQRGNNPES